MKHLNFAIVLTALFTINTTSAYESDLVTHLNRYKVKTNNDSVIIKYSSNIDLLYRQAILNEANASFTDKNLDFVDDKFAPLGLESYHVLALNNADASKVIRKLKQEPAIEFIEPDSLVKVNSSTISKPNDTHFDSLWALKNTGQDNGLVNADINALNAWSYTKGDRNVVIGIIDSGIDYQHPDLIDNLWINPFEIPNDGIDNDGNGYVDDIHGINSITNDGDPQDDLSHGTHIAGIIAASGNNDEGVVGVNWQSQIASCKFLNREGYGAISDAITCFTYFVTLKRYYGVNIVALNNSWGNSQYSQALADVISHAEYDDIVVVAAAGNKFNNNDEKANYPASYTHDNIISVASSNRQDGLSHFSNYGTESVDIAAPGSGIYSTEPNNSYGWQSGTSMSAGYVTGALALAKAYNPYLTASELKNAVLTSGKPVAAFVNKMQSAKRLDIANLMQVADPEAEFYVYQTASKLTIEAGETGFVEYKLNAIRGAYNQYDIALLGFDNYAIEWIDNETFRLYLPSELTQTPLQAELVVTIRSQNDEYEETLSLQIKPANLKKVTLVTDVNQPIPDNDEQGISSAAYNEMSGSVHGINITPNIAHPFIGDLTVSLINPNFESITLHNRSGNSSDDIHKTYALPSYSLKDAMGEWQLAVNDQGRGDVGELMNWQLDMWIEDNSVAPKLDIAIPDNQAQGIFNGKFVEFSGELKNIHVIVDISHSFIGDLTVKLRSPSGQEFSLHNREGGGTDNLYLSLDLADELLNENINGLWLLTVIDSGKGDTGSLINWQIHAVGETSKIEYSQSIVEAIPDKSEEGIRQEMVITEDGQLASGNLTVDITHPFIRDLTVMLISPDGIEYIVHQREGGSSDDINATFTLEHFIGEQIKGTWTLFVNDQGWDDMGTLNSWSLTLDYQ